MTLSEKRSLISALHKEYSVREICETLGFNRSSFYYHSQEDPSEDALRSEIETLAGRYPRYGYRRITQLLLRMGYTVGTRRVARLMRTHNLLVAVKSACRTTQSSQDAKPWDNRLENLEVSRQDQVWVSDITYVRLNGRFIYVCLLMDVFTRMIRAWQLSQHLTQSLTLTPLEEALCHSVPEIHHPIKAFNIFQMLISQRSNDMVLRFRLPVAGVLGRTGMLKDSSALSRRKKFTSMTMRISPRLEIASGILSHTSIIRNAHIRR